MKWIIAFLDDILMLLGLGCLTGAGFIIWPPAGLSALGVSLIILSVVAARTTGRLVNVLEKRDKE